MQVLLFLHSGQGAQNLIMRVLVPQITEIEANNSKRNETNYLVNISVVIYL
jgi:hypothetical protein